MEVEFGLVHGEERTIWVQPSHRDERQPGDLPVGEIGGVDRLGGPHDAECEVDLTPAHVGQDGNRVDVIAKSLPHQEHRVFPMRRIAVPQLRPGVGEVDSKKIEPLSWEVGNRRAKCLRMLVRACRPGRPRIEVEMDLHPLEDVENPIDGPVRRAVPKPLISSLSADEYLAGTFSRRRRLLS